MLPLQYDRPYIWCPNIYSRPFELYPLYKCRAGHQVFSKVTLSQGAARLNQHYMASAEHTIGRTQLSAEQTVGRIHCWHKPGCGTTQSALHGIGRTHYRQNTTVGRIHCRHKPGCGTTQLALHGIGRTHYWQNTLLAEYTVGRTQQRHNMLSAIYHWHNALQHYTNGTT